MEPLSRAEALARMQPEQAAGALHTMHPKDRVVTLAHMPGGIRDQTLARPSPNPQPLTPNPDPNP